MREAELIETHPTLFHMAADGAWPRIRKHGLLSTSAILDLASVEGSRRQTLEEQRRPDSVVLKLTDGDEFILRDQKPLNPTRLAGCLDGMTVPEWLRLLNGKVFLWPTRRRCEHLLGARAYRDAAHTVVEIDTERLLETYRESITLTRINSGAVLYDPPRRGRFTFLPLDDVPFDEWRRKAGSRQRAISEVAIAGAVRNIEDLTVGVYRARGSNWALIA